MGTAGSPPMKVMHSFMPGSCVPADGPGRIGKVPRTDRLADERCDPVVRVRKVVDMADKKRKFSGDPVMVENVMLNWADTLFKIDEGENGNKKFGCDLLIDKKDTATVRALQQTLLPVYKKGCAEGNLDKEIVKEFYGKDVHGESIDCRKPSEKILELINAADTITPFQDRHQERQNM
ncbi:hypothetical protein Uis1B_1215 [Bifidobacterium margollesii]|uniref:Uncharacterized protein n=2 Tax=Bifidobacterium margollesii TaxID=2020964 RepID=A0A2N5J9N8_9BIFI|nr:hypothetical protein Uis1B_1215 [Bifidobacterium margollesii]